MAYMGCGFEGGTGSRLIPGCWRMETGRVGERVMQRETENLMEAGVADTQRGGDEKADCLRQDQIRDYRLQPMNPDQVASNSFEQLELTSAYCPARYSNS